MDLQFITARFGKSRKQPDGVYLQPNLDNYIDEIQNDVRGIIHFNKPLFDEIQAFFVTPYLVEGNRRKGQPLQDKINEKIEVEEEQISCRIH